MLGSVALTNSQNKAVKDHYDRCLADGNTIVCKAIIKANPDLDFPTTINSPLFPNTSDRPINR